MKLYYNIRIHKYTTNCIHAKNCLSITRRLWILQHKSFSKYYQILSNFNYLHKKNIIIYRHHVASMYFILTESNVKYPVKKLFIYVYDYLKLKIENKAWTSHLSKVACINLRCFFSVPNRKKENENWCQRDIYALSPGNK